MKSTVAIHERGLVVDDDPSVRTLICSLLRQEGYDVVCAGDADEAIHMAEQAGSPLDFLVTDVELGDSDGLDLALAIRRSLPSIRILVVSGKGKPIGYHRAAAQGFLAKPFTADALCQKVRALLDRGAMCPGRRTTTCAVEKL